MRCITIAFRLWGGLTLWDGGLLVGGGGFGLQHAVALPQGDDEVVATEVLLAGVGGGVELNRDAPGGVAVVRDGGGVGGVGDR